MMQRVMKGRMVPMLVVFFAVLLPQFVINLFSDHNYFIASVIGAILGVYLVIFAMFFVKYTQYKEHRK